MKEFGNLKHMQVEEVSKDGTSSFETRQVTLADASFVFDILFNQMYRDPIGSVIREITSNCFDSHIEAKVDKAVVVEFNDDDGGDYISFKDVGIGISPDRMSNIYIQATKSTKRNTDDQIGYWGLGSKSPLAYTESFYLTTIYDGLKYEYLVYRGSKNTPEVTLINTTATSEGNGSVVKVYFNKYSDRELFVEKIKEQLKYFDNVYVKGAAVNNYYKIYEGKTFKFRDDSYLRDELHLVIGKVVYPINWQKIGKEAIYLPFALKFNIGDLPITPERESIRYITKETEEGEVEVSDIIVNKISNFLDELQGLVDAEDHEHNNLRDYFANKDNKTTVTLLEKKIEVHKYVVTKPHTYPPLHAYGINIPNNPFIDYRIIASLAVSQSQVRKYKASEVLKLGRFDEALVVRQFKPVAKYRTVFTEYLKYLARKQGKSWVVFVNHEPIKLRHRLDELELPKSSKLDYTKYNRLKLVKRFNNVMLQEVIMNSIDYHTLDPKANEEWYAQFLERTRNEIIRRRPEEGEIEVQDLCLSKNNKRIVDLDNLPDYPFIVYGFTEDEPLMKEWYLLLSSGEFANGSFFIIKKRDEKHVIAASNTIKVNSLMSDNPIFKKVATAILIQKSPLWQKGLVPLGGPAGRRPIMTTVFNQVFTPVTDKMDKLNKASKHTINTQTLSSADREPFITELLRVAETNNLVDKEAMGDLAKCEKYFDGLPLLDYIVDLPQAIPYIAEYVDSKGKPVNKIWVDTQPWEIELIEELTAKVGYFNNLDDQLQSRNRRLYTKDDESDKRALYNRKAEAGRKIVAEEFTIFKNYYYGKTKNESGRA